MIPHCMATASQNVWGRPELGAPVWACEGWASPGSWGTRRTDRLWVVSAAGLVGPRAKCIGIGIVSLCTWDLEPKRIKSTEAS
jgi:hypothetical protein